MHHAQWEHFLKAFANRRRLAILSILSKKGEMTVADIADAIGLSFKATSKHLAILKSREIVRSEQRSLQAYHRLASPVHPMTGVVLGDLQSVSNSRE